MPLINSSNYLAPRWLPGGHCQTIYPAFFRKVAMPDARTFRIPTPDGDFLLLELAVSSTAGGEHHPTSHGDSAASVFPGGEAPETAENKRLVILSHGLEGHSRRQYILGMARAFMDAGWDALAWNQRFCTPFAPLMSGRGVGSGCDGVGEPNNAPRMYHSSETGDLRTVLEYALTLGYTGILLIGFSMGGNQILKYLGDEGDRVPPQVLGGITISVPCDLTSSCRELSRGFNKVYVKNFLKTLLLKMKSKHAQFPELFNIENIDAIRDFKEFDERYTAPLHGFASAEDYWAKASSRPVLGEIRRPVLLVNALNDPFLPTECMPYEEARTSGYLFLETPDKGGHVGFTASEKRPWGDLYWSEWRALEFALQL